MTSRGISSAPASPAIVNVSCPVRPSDCDRVAVLELERQHAHPDEVRAVDPLEALGDHGAHAEQPRALGGPVAARARAVLLAGEHDQRHALLDVAHRGVVDRHLLAVGAVAEVQRHAALGRPARSWLRRRMLANVPRIITSWLPRREP